MPNAKERCKDIRDRFYPEHERPAEVIHQRVMALSRPDADFVEVGCGRTGGFVRQMAPAFRTAYGVDPEVTAVTRDGNVQLTPGTAEQLELPDECADLIVSVDVVEHLQHPEKAFAEFLRVLRPGGRILTVTPNKMHPPLVAARLLNHRLRQTINSWATGTEPDDTFRTFYRLNSLGAFEKLAGNFGLEVMSLEYVSNHPEYFMFSRSLYRAAVSFERTFLNARPFAFLRQLIFADFQKPAHAMDSRRSPSLISQTSRQSNLASRAAD
jgi:ubiquinone/menaquinone biosynthesis C-methylase UbiE